MLLQSFQLIYQTGFGIYLDSTLALPLFFRDKIEYKEKE
jgi:hypothetical protein